MMTTKSSPSRPRPVMLCILDGWGYRADSKDNAIAQADTPVWDRLVSTEPTAFLETYGLSVGLPTGQMGNSEVGHMNLGAGRVVMQDLPRIDAALADGSVAKSPILADFIAKLKKSGGACHIVGLMSPGGVHSHQDQMAALAKIVAGAGIPVLVHALLDGRDTPPSSGREFVAKFESDVKGANIRVATLIGRYFAMDRDKRWDRVQLGYDAMVSGVGAPALNCDSGLAAAYAAGESDEFVKPLIVDGYGGMSDGDGLLMANFRADRAREILTAMVDPAFSGFTRSRQIRFAAQLGLVEYSTELNAFLPALFPSESLTRILGEEISAAGMTQLRIAETEKYAHVTFFFNGGREQVFEGEDRILVPSPKVATYDLQPEMSAPEVTDKLVEAIESGKYDMIIANYANGDMVGHTGIMEAAMKAAETVDKCLGRVEAALRKAGGTMLVTADHGNAELMRDQTTGEPYTAHTVGKVKAVLVGGPADVKKLHDGCLADVAPTMLALMHMPQPAEMTGKCLLET